MGSIADAARDNKIDKVREYIANGADVNAYSPYVTVAALHFAASNGNVEMIELLLDNGANINIPTYNGETPLFQACDKERHQAALVLISRGASANLHGGQGRTALQMALRRGSVKVVRAMLEAGVADPNIKSYGGFKETITFVKGSTAERAQLTELLEVYTSLDTAVKAKDVKAIEAMVKRAFFTNNLLTAVEMFLNANKVLKGLVAYQMRLLVSCILANRPDWFQPVLLCDMPTPTYAGRLALLQQVRFDGDARTTALHLAAQYGLVQFVEYLVGECGLNPEILDARGRQAIDMITDQTPSADQLRKQLSQAAAQRRFQLFTSGLLSLSGDVVSTGSVQSDLEAMAHCMTSVHDLRSIFNLGLAKLSDNRVALKQVLSRTLTQLIQDKLVVNDQEALFCKLVLKECARQELLSEEEVEFWDLQVIKVNMESATWAKALKQSVRNLEWKATDLENQTKALQVQYMRLHRAIEVARQQRGILASLSGLRHVLSLFSLVLSVAGADGVSSVLDTVVDLTSPISVLTTTFTLDSPEAANAFVATGAPVSVRASVAPVLSRAAINPVDLARLLREAAELENEANGVRPSLPRPVISYATPPRVSEVKAPVAKVATTTPTTATNVIDCGDSDAFPFHYAVKQSRGNLKAFYNIFDFIDDHYDCSELAEVHVAGKMVEINAAVYASFLGYPEIVKHFLDDERYKSSKEPKFVTMQRAHSMKKRAQQPAAASA